MCFHVILCILFVVVFGTTVSDVLMRACVVVLVIIECYVELMCVVLYSLLQSAVDAIFDVVLLL